MFRSRPACSLSGCSGLVGWKFGMCRCSAPGSNMQVRNPHNCQVQCWQDLSGAVALGGFDFDGAGPHRTHRRNSPSAMAVAHGEPVRLRLGEIRRSVHPSCRKFDLSESLGIPTVARGH